MNLRQKLDRIWLRYGLRELSFYISVIFAAGFILLKTEAGFRFYERYLAFYPANVLHGQIWRILTACIYPPVSASVLLTDSLTGILLGALYIFIYYNFASAVERGMGTADFALYFFGSILSGELGCVVYYLITGQNAPFLPIYTHFSVFMAFAVLYSESQVLLFFMIPVKVTWIALLEAVIYLNDFFRGNLYTKISIAAAFLPVIVFYFICMKKKSGTDVIGRIRFRMQQKKRQKEWKDQWR